MSSDSTPKIDPRTTQPDNIWKNSTNNWRTMTLFLEAYDPSETPIYTLKEYDYKGLPSLKRLYIELEDLTEYEFANMYLGGWSHWEKMQGRSELKEHFDKWRKELQLKLKARALGALVKTANDPNNRNTYEANKFLITGGWIPKEDKEAKRGRPSKDEVKEELNKQLELERTINEDLKRLELN